VAPRLLRWRHANSATPKDEDEERDNNKGDKVLIKMEQERWPAAIK
jgi:hypothetical protein